VEAHGVGDTDAHSGWGRGRILIILLVVSVAQAALGQGDEHQRRHAQADKAPPLPGTWVNKGKEMAGARVYCSESLTQPRKGWVG
jgi:hypothetical protein